MDPIRIEPTERSPMINFDFGANKFLIKGESYPEDVAAFYGSVLETLQSHLGSVSDGEVNFEFELIYFNSSTAKVLMGLFETLDECAGSGNTVSIVWKYEEDDDNMQELGEEFAEDLEHAEFKLEEIPVD
jgi:hypothetical protein